MAADKEKPMAIEVAVTIEGKVSVNIQHLPVGVDGWGHLTFDVPQAVGFVQALQQATIEAHRQAQLLAVKTDERTH